MCQGPRDVRFRNGTGLVLDGINRFNGCTGAIYANLCTYTHAYLAAHLSINPLTKG